MAEQFLALLRGVNVGGVKVLMAPLRDMCEGFGWTDVRTYIASGNLTFRADGPPNDHAAAIETGLAVALGRAPDVIVYEADRFRRVVADHPFEPEKGNQSHIYFCWDEPVIDAALYEALKTPEEVRVVDGHVHFHAPNGIGRSELANRFDKIITGTKWTGRNLNTCRKLVAMLDQADAG